MNKRRVPRYKRRIPLQFWSQDDRTPRKGFTQNVSVMGMFVSTNVPFKPGNRVSLELASGKDKVILQAEVRYSARIDPALQKVMPSGMGIRLLRVDEVMSEILKLKASGVEVIDTPVAKVVVEPEEAAEPETAVFPVTFDNPHDLANTFERDIKYGGLFVAAPETAGKDEKVTLEFRFAWDSSRVVRVEALVVKSFASAEGSVMGEAVSGMGVAFSDPTDVMTQFKDVISDLETNPPQGT